MSVSKMANINVEDKILSEYTKELQSEINQSIFAAILSAYNLLAANNQEKYKPIKLRDLRLQISDKHFSLNIETIKELIDFDKIKLNSIRRFSINESTKSTEMDQIFYFFFTYRTIQNLYYLNEAVFKLIIFLLSEVLGLSIQLNYIYKDSVEKKIQSGSSNDRIILAFNIESKKFSVIVYDENLKSISLPNLSENERMDSTWLIQALKPHTRNKLQIKDIFDYYLCLINAERSKMRIKYYEYFGCKHSIIFFPNLEYVEFGPVKEMAMSWDKSLKLYFNEPLIKKNEDLNNIADIDCEVPYENQSIKKALSELFNKSSNEIFSKDELKLFHDTLSFNNKLNQANKDMIKKIINNLLCLCCSSRLNATLCFCYIQRTKGKIQVLQVTIPPFIININEMGIKRMVALVQCDLDRNKLELSNLDYRFRKKFKSRLNIVYLGNFKGFEKYFNNFKHITLLQMIQFILILILFISPFFIENNSEEI